MSAGSDPGAAQLGAHPHGALHTLLAILLGLLAGFGLMLLASDEPVRALRALLAGPLPELGLDAQGRVQLGRLTRMAAVAEDTINLALLGLAVALGFRARLFSMGADGQLLLAALAAAWAAQTLAAPGLAAPGATLLAVALAVGVGACWGALPGLLKVRWQANEIVTSLMFNLVALQLYRLAISHGFNDPVAGFIATPALPTGAGLQAWWPGTRLGAFVLVAPAVLALAWALLARSTLGYQIRVVGDAPEFARASGLPIGRTQVLALALGGAAAGLAGAHLALAQLPRLPADLAPGLGFEGLMVALLAGNEPRRIFWAALGYAYLKAGGQAMERASDLSRDIVNVVQALIVLLVVCRNLRWPRRWRWARIKPQRTGLAEVETP